MALKYRCFLMSGMLKRLREFFSKYKGKGIGLSEVMPGEIFEGMAI